LSQHQKETNLEELMKLFRIVFLALVSVLLTITVEGQDRITKIRIQLETQIVDWDYRIKVYTADKEVEPLYEDGGIILPEDFKNEKEICIRFSSGEYTLDFGAIDVSDFMTEWVIGIDNDPFEDRNVGHLPGEDRVGPGLLYYIMFFRENGTVKYKRTFINREYKKP
jgi:hypothetical protein